MKMKKSFIFPLLALVMAACSDNDGPWGTPQVNPQEPIFSTENMEVVAEPAAQNTINLLTYNDANELIPLARVSKLVDWPAGYDVKAVMQLSGKADFSTVDEIPVTVTDGVFCVAPDAWQEAYFAHISKGPKEKTNYVRFAISAVSTDGAQEIRIGGPDVYFANMAVQVLPFPSELVIEDSYYLLGSINGWSVAEAVKFSHSDKDVYDDPVFTLLCNVDGVEGWWWKIVPESTYLTGNWVDAANASFGVAENGSDALSGMLVGRTATEDCGAGCLKVSGPFRLTINMEEMTYDWSQAIENLFVIGSGCGWDFGAAQALGTTDYTNYYGFANVGDEFKFTSEMSWSGINYGSTGTPGELTPDGGAGNLTNSTPGFYWCHVNLPELTYSISQITTIGAIGDFNGWAESVALTPSEDMLTWSGVIDFTGGSFKLRCNNDWALSLGGDPNELGWDNAPNIADPGTGKYLVNLYLGSQPYVVEFEAQ